MKKTLFVFALAAGMMTFASCESTREEGTENQTEEIEESAEEVEDETEEAVEGVERNDN